MNSVEIRNKHTSDLMSEFPHADLQRKLEIASETASLHTRYQHYTSIGVLLKMIKSKVLWLTRSNSLALDDWNESKKFGLESVHRRTYIACFSHQVGESAAMWGLYGEHDENQVKLSLPSDVVEQWVQHIERSKDKIVTAELTNAAIPADAKPFNQCAVSFSDVLYASVKGDRKGEKSRDGRIRWQGIVSENQFVKSDFVCEKCTARMKDVEWEFESESRLIVTSKRLGDCDVIRRIAVPLTDTMIASMAITLSPWLPEDSVREYRAVIRKTMREALDLNLLGRRRPYVYRSTLCGALGKWAKNR